MVRYTIEACTNSAESCLEAQRGGAQRVELCAAIPEGGTTPSAGEARQARALTQITLHCIVRPRGGDFCYSSTELSAMEYDIQTFRSLDVDGVVFGCLRPDGTIDTQANKRLMEASDGLSTTFHRAFDVCRDPLAALEDIIALGFHRILTSGQAATAYEGRALIAKLIEQASGRIIIMPGCGVNEDNVAQIAQQTGATEFHSSARHSVASPMEWHNPNVSMGGTVHLDEYKRELTSAARVKQIIKSLNNV